MPACSAFSRAFDTIATPLSGFLTLFPFASMDASAEPYRLYAGETWDNFAIWSLKFTHVIDHPADARLLPVLADGDFCLISGGKCSAGFASPQPAGVFGGGFSRAASEDLVRSSQRSCTVGLAINRISHDP
jgi:hypothetical protein